MPHLVIHWFYSISDDAVTLLALGALCGQNAMQALYHFFLLQMP